MVKEVKQAIRERIWRNLGARRDLAAVSCRGPLGQPTLRPAPGGLPRGFTVASLRGRRSPRSA